MKYVCTVCGYVYEGEELPEDLPKTGSTQYGVIISVLAVLGCSYIVLKNSKKHD